MEGVIFDFNGTMLFDKNLHEQSWREFIKLKTGHIPTDEELQKHMHGRIADYILSYFLKQNFSREESTKLEEEKEIIYRNMCLKSDEFKLVDGLCKFLDKLKEKQIPFTIATASGYGNVKFFYENLNLGRWFKLENIVYNNGKIKSKPDPEMFLKAAEIIGADIKECTIFEDSISGIEAAKNSGAKKIVGVASMIDKETLLKLGANEVIYDYTTL